jgi:NAD/NADP transhydrogenase beta subunit
MGIMYGIVGMCLLMAAYWADVTYTYDDGVWLVAVASAPGAILGLWSAYAVDMTSLPEMVGAYNGFGGLAAALTGYAMYLDPDATYLSRHGLIIVKQTDAMLWVQAIGLILSVVIGMMTFTGSMVAVCKLNGTLSSKPRIIPFRGPCTLLIFVLMFVFGALTFTGQPGWNNRTVGITYLAIVGVISSVYGIVAVMAIGGGDMPVSIAFLNSLSGFSTSATGFMMANKALVVAGAFVGVSGIILTLVMCHAMNRSVANVLLGGFGDGAKVKVRGNAKKVSSNGSDTESEVTVTEMTAE